MTLPIGTRLTPRDADDPILEVGGIEGTRYTLKNAEVFSRTIAMSADELAARYDTTGYSVEIVPFDESRAWFELSTKKYDRGLKAGDGRAREQRAEPSPEQVFAAAAEAAK
jgi:hypothetical protein